MLLLLMQQYNTSPCSACSFLRLSPAWRGYSKGMFKLDANSLHILMYHYILDLGIYTAAMVQHCMISSKGSVSLNYRANILPDTEQILKDG